MSAKTLAIDYFDKKTERKLHLPISVFKRPASVKEADNLAKLLDKITDIVQDNERHPLAVVMQIIGENLEAYDDAHFPGLRVDASDVDIVSYLMEANDFQQKDLADIFGGQANVSKFLNGERGLSKKQILGLKKKFGISADLFFNEKH